MVDNLNTMTVKILKRSLKPSVYETLQKLYENVSTLKQWIAGVESDHGTELIFRLKEQMKLSKRFRDFVSKTLVAIPYGARTLPSSICTAQTCHQHDLVNRNIQKLCELNQSNTNVFSCGFYQMTTKASALVSNHGNFECKFHNQMYGLLLYDNWKRLLSVGGDELMEYLLMVASLFIAIEGSNYIQLTGLPVYDLVSHQRDVQPIGQVMAPIGSSQRSGGGENDSAVGEDKLCQRDNTTMRRGKRKRRGGKNRRRKKSKMDASESCPVVDHLKVINMTSLMFGGSFAERVRSDAFIASLGSASDWSRIFEKIFSQNVTKSELDTDVVHQVVEYFREMRNWTDVAATRSGNVDVNCDTSIEKCRSVVSDGRNEGVDFVEANRLVRVKQDCDNEFDDECDRGCDIGCDRGCDNERNDIRRDKGCDKGFDDGCDNRRHIRFDKGDDDDARDIRGDNRCDNKRDDGRDNCDITRVSGHSANTVVKPADSCDEGRTDATHRHDPRDTATMTAVVRLNSMDSRGRITGRQADGVCVRVTKQSLRKQSPFAGSYISVYEKIEVLLQKFIQRHRRCPYRALLHHYCTLAPNTTVPQTSRSPVASSRKPLVYTRFSKSTVITSMAARSVQEKRRAKNALHDNSLSLRQVYLFLRCVCFKVIPFELIGSKHNWSQWMKVLLKILRRGKFDRIRLGQVLEGIKVNDCEWVQGVSSHPMKRVMMAQLLYWLLTDFILVVTKSLFYVTDSCTRRNKLFYFCRSVWLQLQFRAKTEYMKQGLYAPTTAEHVRKSLTRGQSLGVSFLRFTPKFDTFRPIVNMQCNTSIADTKEMLPINKQLSAVYHILKYITDESPDLIGCSVYGPDDIYRKWRSLIEKRRVIGDRRPLYFVKVDIRGCYDNIIQQKLYDIIASIVDQGPQEYKTYRYATVYASRGRVKRSFHHLTRPSHTHVHNFVQFVKNRGRTGQSYSKIYVDKVTATTLKVNDLLKKLHAHLFHNFVKLHSLYYHQDRGITQGSVLSTLLCNLYFADMEKRYLQVESDELLLRMVDDYLYVTPQRKRAMSFLNTLCDGIVDYNCRVNESKLLVNFVCRTNVGIIPQNVAPEAQFPWCGMLFDPLSLSVSVDYSAYTHTSISETITFDLGHEAGEGLRNKLLNTLRPKCHPLYLDTNINKRGAVITSILHLFLMSAYRFHSYCGRLPHHHSPQHNPHFFFSVVRTLHRSLPVYTQVKMKKLQAAKSSTISADTVSWLCYKAFLMKLSTHKSLYSRLLKVIQAEVKRLTPYMLTVGDLELVDDRLTIPVQFTQMLR